MKAMNKSFTKKEEIFDRFYKDEILNINNSGMFNNITIANICYMTIYETVNNLHSNANKLRKLSKEVK